MEPVWIQYGEPRATARCCRRCGSAQVRALGHAGSNLSWFACYACSYVWGFDEHGKEESTPLGPPPAASVPPGQDS